uniref:Protein slit n=1 Tax=Ascaris lumbricoides TaxID=6252 RepID=A0A0M3HND7_ASCLU
MLVNMGMLAREGQARAKRRGDDAGCNMTVKRAPPNAVARRRGAISPGRSTVSTFMFLRSKYGHMHGTRIDANTERYSSRYISLVCFREAYRDLQENKISVVRKDDLAALGQLKILQLMDNQIQMIEDNAFDNLLQLERLRLNRNRLRVLPEGVFINNRNLHRLDLSENFLSVLTDSQLQGPRSMRNLQLDRNLLTCVDSQILSTWTQMEILTLNANNLSTLGEIIPMPNLRVLRLADNPWLCDCRLRWIKKVISAEPALASNSRCHRPAHLHSRTIASIDEQVMKCSGIEKRAASSCREAAVCPSVCTCTESTVDCRDRGLTHIPANLPSSVLELRLEQNQITYIPPRAFHNLYRLKRLDLSKNSIVEIAPRAFDGLRSLNSLVLYGNSLTDLPSEAFHGLFNIQLLLLNANKLQCLRKETFKNLSNLNLLSLYDNNIKSIANGTFDGLTNLMTLHLARNPIICDCNLEWLAMLLSIRAVETSGARCESPKRVARRRLATLHHSKFRCKGSESYVTARADECIIDYGCPVECSCHGSIVDCSKRGLTEFPSNIPLFTTELHMSHNKISSIRNSANFRRLTNLKKLDLSENRLRHFSASQLGESSSTLQTLNLSNNSIRCIAEGAMLQLPNIHSIAVGNNDFICNCHIADFANYLRVNGSRVLDSPKCHEPKHFRGRPIATVNKDELSCKSAAENVCAENGTYCPAGCICQGTVVRCSNRALKEFPPGIPLETTELFLDSNDITSIPLAQLNKLYQLAKLDLSHNRITVIESGAFANLTKLSTLILSYNKLQCLEPAAFSALSNLRILSLHGNDLSVLPESAFANLTNITHIALGSNALYCDCHMAWFSKWIKARFVEAGIARCELPLSTRNQLLLTANEHHFKCEGPLPKTVLAKCDPCIDNPCRNGAKCKRTHGRSFLCECVAGFHGRLCEDHIDACYGHPCLNNASCKVIQDGRFTCHCSKGFEGDRCETNIDDCVGNKCENGGTCIDLINSYECKCPRMYVGQYCEEKLEYCSKKLNPCQNGGICTAVGDSYSCKCLPGFTGTNCSVNIDDCIDNLCKNNAICVDGVQSYACNCIDGYTGKFCELAPISNDLYPNISPCHAHSCDHGTCRQTESDIVCSCFEGYSGQRCDRLRAVGFAEHNAFVALEPWNTAPVGNLTLTLITTESTGIIAYYGDDAHISAELYDGRVKVSFYVGNYPASHMYSYVTVHDGLPHQLQVLIEGKTATLKIDSAQPQKVVNSGRKEALELKSKSSLYLGGLPPNAAKNALDAFHVKHAHSFQGCISDVFVNGEAVDFDKVEKRQSIQSGCSHTVDVCRGVECHKGACISNATMPLGYECHCEPGYSGKYCESREVFCTKEKFRRVHEEDGCRSVEPIKNALCSGWCGEGNECCTAVKGKRRRVKMHCKDGSTNVRTVHIVRKCECATQKKCLRAR